MDTRYDFRGGEDETWYDLDQDLAFFSIESSFINKMACGIG